MPDITFKEDEHVIEVREDVGLDHIPSIGDKMVLLYLVEGIDHKMVVGESYNVRVKIKRIGALKCTKKP